MSVLVKLSIGQENSNYSRVINYRNNSIRRKLTEHYKIQQFQSLGVWIKTGFAFDPQIFALVNTISSVWALTKKTPNPPGSQSTQSKSFICIFWEKKIGTPENRDTSPTVWLWINISSILEGNLKLSLQKQLSSHYLIICKFSHVIIYIHIIM